MQSTQVVRRSQASQAPSGVAPQAPAATSGVVRRLGGWAARNMVLLLLLAYGVAAMAPGLGLWLRHLSLGELRWGAVRLPISGPTLLLSALLFNATLGVDTAQLRATLRHRSVLGWGLVANATVRLAGSLLLVVGLRAIWPEAEVQSILVALALVACMPIAGSCAAWVQQASGNVALTLGLVLGSTLLSPAVSGLGLRLAAALSRPPYAAELRELAGGETQLFLLVAVLVPTALALAARRSLGAPRVHALLPVAKAVNSLVLLLLVYTNASLALPQVVRHPEGAFLALACVCVALICLLAFVSGLWVARWAGAGTGEQVALMFALGMNNNGSGLVLAATALAHRHKVLLVLVAYNLVQQLAAGLASRWAVRSQRHAA